MRKKMTISAALFSSALVKATIRNTLSCESSTGYAARVSSVQVIGAPGEIYSATSRASADVSET